METTKIQAGCQLIFCFLLAIAIQTNLYLVGDNSWLLHVTDSLWRGGRYYQDFFETNPPMILYLYLPAVWLDNIFHLALATGFRIYFFTLTLLGLLACHALLKKIITPTDNGLHHILLVAIAFCLWLLPAIEFGEREHAMLILVLPYLLLMVLRAQNNLVDTSLRSLVHPTIGVVIGFFAGLGLAIKPYFLLAPLFIEIYLIIKNKKLFFFWRSENITIACVFVLYVISIIIFTPEYFTKILPLVNDLYFPGLPASLGHMFFTFPVWGWLLLLACYWMGKNIQAYREFDHLFFLAATGFMLAFIVQCADWYYHWLPALTCQTLLLVKMLATNYQAKKNSQSESTQRIVRATLMYITLILFTGASFFMMTYKNLINPFSSHSYIKDTTKLINQHAARGSAIYFLFPFLSGAYPLIDHVDVYSASRFPGLVFLPGLYKKMAVAPNDPDVIQKKQWMINMVLEDFYHHPPALVFVEKATRTEYFGGKPFDYLKFFNSDARFNNMFNTCYRRLTVHYTFVVYQNKCAKLPAIR